MRGWADSEWERTHDMGRMIQFDMITMNTINEKHNYPRRRCGTYTDAHSDDGRWSDSMVVVDVVASFSALA
jgi:hypothetical protein